MAFAGVWLFLLSMLSMAGTALAQPSFDFEPGEPSWTRDPVFSTQPIDGGRVLTGTIGRSPLGGDYWRGLHYPLGQHGHYLVATAEGNLGDAATGVLTSPEFRIDQPWLSMLMGGTNDPANERAELQVRFGNEFFTYFSATGGTEALRQVLYRVPDSASGHMARIRIVDASPHGHINVDYIRFTAGEPGPHRTPVWGYADYHTHPMSYLAFGALQEDPQHVIWGSPGGSIEDYDENNYRAACDIPHCTPGHGGGPLAELFLDIAQSLNIERFSKWTLRAIFPHPRDGGPEFGDFPTFYRGAHQQMHITQIRRNYDGGLRLMVGLATDNLGAEYLTSKTRGGEVHPTRLQDSMEAQICGMLRMAELNSSWMEIAYTAEDARRIILENKLAVIMGVEVDRLLEEADPQHPRTPAEEVVYLWSLGVRAVTPIHAINNRFGGAAVFVDAYNWTNDLEYRGKHDIPVEQLDAYPPKFFQVSEDTGSVTKGETVLFRLQPEQLRVGLARIPGSHFQLAPFIWPKPWPDYQSKRPNPPGQKNAQPFTADGAEFIRALMSKGMIVDIAHMSDVSVAGTFQTIDGSIPDYPAIMSHAHYRAQAHYEEGAPVDLRPTEYFISDSTLKRFHDKGGVAGTFTAQSMIEEGVPGFPNDCPMSSKSFGNALHFAVERLGFGTGMATDFTFIAGVSPRFGPDACAGYKIKPSLKYEMKPHNGKGHEHSRPHDQVNAIVYDGIDQHDVRLGHNAPLKPYRMAYRTYDFNVDGLAHYGLVPDLLQDLKNVDPYHQSDLEHLFTSAEDYLEMWEKSESLSQCNAGNAFCSPVPPALRCRLPGALPCQ
ncbi:MAG TPA: membrane dipeptidase [Bryobacteraceae bacterium]|nr:membrane dipeptidase [Bryobacteraceae bacterium]